MGKTFYQGMIERFLKSDVIGQKIDHRMSLNTKYRYEKMYPNLKIIITEYNTYFLNRELLAKAETERKNPVVELNKALMAAHARS